MENKPKCNLSSNPVGVDAEIATVNLQKHSRDRNLVADAKEELSCPPAPKLRSMKPPR